MSSPNRPNKRKYRPCDSCRRRKSRCVVGDDEIICVLCKFHNYECTFLENIQPRKRRRSEDAVNDGPKRRRQSETTVNVQDQPPTTSGPWRRVHGAEEYDDLQEASLLKRTLGLLNSHHIQHVGATSALEPAVIAGQSSVSHHDASSARTNLRWVSATEAFLLVSDTDTVGYTEEIDDIEAIEAIVRPHGQALIDIYFRVVYPSFPVLYRDVYLEKYKRSPKEFSPSSLAVVYLLASRYWSYDENLQNTPKPDVEKLEALTRKALGDAMHRPKISTIQAGLQLLQYGNSDPTELSAQLIGIAYGLGLHLDASDWDIPDWEKSLRKRLSWALYLQDKWNSLQRGRPSLLNEAHWAVRRLVEADFPEHIEYDQEGSSEFETGRVLFCHLIELTEILAEIQNDILSVRTIAEITNAGAIGLALLLERAKPIQLKLKEWHRNLPAILSMECSSVTKLSSVSYLQLAYIATEITLHRRILLAKGDETDPSLVRICRNVARERFQFAISFVKALQPHHLSSFWYSEALQHFALIGTFGCYLYMTETSDGPRQTYWSMLREYRWMIKIISDNGASFIRSALDRLDIHLKCLVDPKTSPSVAFERPASYMDLHVNSLQGSGASGTQESSKQQLEYMLADEFSSSQFYADIFDNSLFQ